MYLDMKAFLKQQFKQNWEVFWKLKINNKLFQVDPSIGKRDFGGFNTRLDEIKFTRLRLGHTWLTNKYLLMGEPQPICNVCHCYLTIYHILICCPMYEEKRKHFLGNFEIKIEDVLERGDLQKNRSVINFLNATKLYGDI